MVFLTAVALFVIAMQVGAVLVWEEAYFAWASIFYFTVFALAMLGGNPTLLPSALLWKCLVGLAGFVTGSALCAWRTERMT